MKHLLSFSTLQKSVNFSIMALLISSLFLIIPANPVSADITGSNAMVSHDVAYTNSSVGIRWQQKTFYAQDNYWAFFVNAYPAGGYDSVAYYCSSPDGDTWSTPVYCDYISGGELSGENLQVVTNSTHIWLVTRTAKLSFGQLNTNGTITFIKIGQYTDSQNFFIDLPTPINYQLSWSVVDFYIAMDSSNYLWYMTAWTQPNFYNITSAVYKNAWTNGSWSLDSYFYIPPTGEYGSNANNALIPLADDQMYILSYAGKNTVRGYLWNGTALGSMEVCSQSSIASDSDYWIYGDPREGYGRAITTDEDGNIYIAFPTTDNRLVICTRNHETGIWTEQQISSSVLRGCCPALNWLYGVLNVFWIYDSSSFAYMRCPAGVPSGDIYLNTITGTIPMDELFEDVYGWNAYLNAFSFSIDDNPILLYVIYNEDDVVADYKIVQGIFEVPTTALTFHGLYNEQTNDLEPDGVNVTAVFSSSVNSTVDTTSFFVNGTYYYYSLSTAPQYFIFDLGNGVTRQYWMLPEENYQDIYIYNSSDLAGYVVNFNDMSGVLSDYPFIEIHRNIDGVDVIVERLKVDVQNKILTYVRPNNYYTIKIVGGSVSYTFGDLLFALTNPIYLTLKGFDFPQEIIIGYPYIRIYADRYNDFQTIKISFEDTQYNLDDVTFNIYLADGVTQAIEQQNYTSTYGFTYTWLMAQENLTYIFKASLETVAFGDSEYSQVLAGSLQAESAQPFNLPLGFFTNIETGEVVTFGQLFAMIIIGACFLIFSRFNVYVGGIFAVAMAILMAVLGWIYIPIQWCLLGLFVSVMLGIAYSKRRVITTG